MKTKQKAQALVNFWQDITDNDNGFSFDLEIVNGGPNANSDLSRWHDNPPKEIDWLKVPINTKVLVSDDCVYDLSARYFCCF